MPELPEVETVKRTLNELVVGKTIQKVSVHLPRIIIKPDDIVQFATACEGQTIQRIERRGKFLRILLDDLVLVSHLRMEGRYGVFPSDEPLEKHTHVVFHMQDGTDLRYKDVRQFGTMHLFAHGDDLKSLPLKKLGDEPLDPEFTLSRFSAKMKVRTSRIKPLLLNQELVAGLGNIYVDEALHASGIHPERRAHTLSDSELSRLHQAIIETLQHAVEAGGSSIKSYVNGQGEMGMFQQQLRVYGRTDQPCTTCDTLIVKMVVSGRGTHYCPTCQPFSSSQSAASG